MYRKSIPLVVLFLVVGAGIGFVIGYVPASLTISRYQSEISTLRTTYDQLKTDYTSLNTTYNNLQRNYTYLQSHSFTYYLVDNKLNITNLQVKRPSSHEAYIKGNITNISNTSIDLVYVLVIAKNPDSTLSDSFSLYKYDELHSLYIGETMPFEIDYLWGLNGNETFEILLIY